MISQLSKWYGSLNLSPGIAMTFSDWKVVYHVVLDVPSSS